ncbi:hypothetical protein B0H16DRAFT_1462645 [Mycena metata]|uniref:Uncharacterized protein n=1 Tax=Mycena metata TaxID=1033252 RepID=A0AAD7ILT1_9AGAR|nr:hypothetical protein B0H16DRAFT_1462645 [Mycena metata]
MPKKTRYSTRAATRRQSRRSSSPVKKTDVKVAFDDEARESEVTVDEDSDGELGEDNHFGTPDLTPPPAEQVRAGLTPRDMEAIAPDDSMFRRPSGVKATPRLTVVSGSALPPSLVTRSKRSITEATSSASAVPAKKARHGEAVSSSSSGPADSPAQRQVSFDPDAMARFMTSWMEEFMAKQGVHSQPVTPAKPPRVDFDQLELARGLAASRAEQAKTIRSSSPGSKMRDAPRSSPVWDIEEPSEAQATSSKGKGKGKIIGRKVKAADEVEDVFNSAPADSELVDVVDKARAASRSQLSGFVIHGRKGSTQAAVNSALEDDGMTIGKFFKDHTAVVVDAVSGSRAGSTSDSGDPPSTAFLEDLETYKSFFDPDAPCGVDDPDIQDPALAATYRRLPPLPAGRRILPAYDPSRVSGGSIESDTKGGRAKFSSWKTHIKSMLARNCIGAMLFVECKPNFINPSRVSPLSLSRQAATGPSATQRLLYDSQIAVCLSAVFCTDSVVVSAGKIGGKSERMRKWLSGIFHNQDWERFESLMCLVFGQDVMYAQISNKKAISFQTMISPEGAATVESSDSRFDKNAPSDMFSPIIPKKTTPAKVKTRTVGPGTPSKTLLSFNEHLPVYDARKTPFDFEFDLPRLSSVLPPFTGEIPFSSFVVVGYTVSAYNGALGGTTERVMHLGCNIVWAIVCGTPTLRK